MTGGGCEKVRSGDGFLPCCAFLKSITIVGVRLCLRLVERAAQMGLRVGPRLVPSDAELGSDEALDAYLLRTATTGHHPCGTCAMGSRARGGVVDSEGRVLGAEGLRVADASIMPDCPSECSNGWLAEWTVMLSRL